MVRRSIFLMIPFLVAGYYALWGGEYSQADLLESRKRVEEMRHRVEAMGIETRRLEARVVALEADLWELEVVARERFGMVRPGETLYRFTEPVRMERSEVDTGHLPR